MKKIKKLLLINPVNKQKGLAATFFTRFQPMGMGIIAGLTPTEIEVCIIDENFDNFEEKIKKIGDIDLVGITAFTPTVVRGYEIASYFKGKRIPVIMGGIHVSLRPEEALQHCDTVVIGEGELLWPKVLADAEAGKLEKMYKNDDLIKEIPIGRYKPSILTNKYFWGAVQTTRGCPMDCDFCSVTMFNGFKYRRRSNNDIIDELKQIKQKFVLFYDDNVVGRTAEQKEYALDLFKRIVKEKISKKWLCQCSINIGAEKELLNWMHKAGCSLMCVGFESVDEDNLRKMHKNENLVLLKKYPELIKNIHESGIAVIGNFVIGYPHDTQGTAKTLTDFIISNGVDALQVTHLTPFPGTKLFSRLEKEKKIVLNNYPADWEKYNFSNVAYRHEHLTEDELMAIVNNIKSRIVAPFPMLAGRFFKTLFATKSLSSALMALAWNAGLREIFNRGQKKRRIQAGRQP